MSPTSRHRRRYFAAAGIVATLALGLGLLVSRRETAPDCGSVPVLLITVDTLRADALSALGSRVATPRIDALAREGALFEQAVSAAPLTGPSHATILTGLYPNRHGIRDNGQVLGTDPPGLAAWLGACGYAGGGFVSGFPLHRQFGFDHGFDHYDDNFAAAAGNNPFALRERRAEDTVRAALAWINQRQTPDWFAWVHLYDPHTPYAAPEAFRQTGENGAYLAEVAYTDHWVGELVRDVRRRYPDAVVVLTSDHGEGLGEHGEYDHGLLLYQSTMRVPLIVSAPGRVPAQRQSVPVRTADIAPTVLALAGAPVPAGLDGIDLLPALHTASAPAAQPAYSESYFGAYTYGWAPLQALREGDWKRIQGVRGEVFDLSADPHETTPRNDAAAATRDARLESLLASLPQPARSAAQPDAPSAEATARLRSLGYLSAGSPDTPARWRNDVDPRDRLAEHAAVLQAQQALDGAHWPEAERRLRELVLDHPDNRVAWLRLGALLMAKRDVEGGLLSLDRAVELDPENPETRYQLAEALLRARRFAAAADAWAEVTRRQPKRAAAWSNLGAALLFDGRTDAAISALEQAVALSPGAANLLENLAQAQLRGGRRGAAIATLRQQAQLQGDAFPLAALLALQLAGEGDRAGAEQWLGRARPGQDSYAEAHLALAVAWAGEDRPRAAGHLRHALAAKPQLRDTVAASAELAGLLDAPPP
ncbi:MAG TPA: sulfatase-like hydrolase/transferase [Tahibacter sp.]|uniref:sulfatase-like hydrolase/transferase n=1 Tax=Tahibacter sp. TaxID=2056211 RepID=UPI002BC28A1D|nr:sulfatase-like hydrolase/transferase [Tahibacter sp.]HSX59751.1 sulfatase-like hydrolase/transferase [Tahibacter sp.]